MRCKTKFSICATVDWQNPLPVLGKAHANPVKRQMSLYFTSTALLHLKKDIWGLNNIWAFPRTGRGFSHYDAKNWWIFFPFFCFLKKTTKLETNQHLFNYINIFNERRAKDTIIHIQQSPTPHVKQHPIENKKERLQIPQREKMMIIHLNTYISQYYPLGFHESFSLAYPP